MNRICHSLVVSTAVSIDASNDSIGCNAHVSLTFHSQSGLDDLWRQFRPVLFARLDHRHLGKTEKFEKGESGYWQIPAVVESVLQGHKELYKAWISTRVEIAGQQTFESYRD